jgi:phosphoribosylaminoimidazole-succinocarboxamide synthase
MSPLAAESLPHLYSGKVRELYGLPGDRMLLVASDRISAFDYVLPTEIPDKGRILTQMSLWWFGQLEDVVPHHLVDPEAGDSADIPAELAGRAVVVERLEMLPVECVARGYLAGSGLVDYRRSGSVCGIPLPAGLVDGSRLPSPVFTPATKAPRGQHDENVAFDAVVATIGEGPAELVRELTLACYSRGEQIARQRGIIVADTKLEFGRRADGTVVLADEVLTPDSSRFWPADEWEPGRSQPSYDKQYVRDWLLSPESGWDRSSGAPPPPLPDRVVEQTRERYVEAYERLTGERFA